MFIVTEILSEISYRNGHLYFLL